MSKKAYPGQGVQRIAAAEIRQVTRAAGDGDATTYEVAVSSETEVTRYGWFEKWREVLGHSSGEIDMARFKSGRAAVLEEHDGPPIGVIESARVGADNVLRAIIRFSQSTRGQEVENDVKAGIRANVSVGYIPKRARMEEENEEQGDLWRVTKWEPVELSIVGIPADATVGVGRSAKDDPAFPPVEIEVHENREVRTMKTKSVRGPDGTIIEVPETDERAAVSPREAELEAEEKRRSALLELGTSSKVPLAKVRGWIDSNISLEQALRQLLEERATRSADPAPGADPELWMARKDRSAYSLCRAVLGASDIREGKSNLFTGLEREVDQELGKTFTRQRGGVLVPLTLGVSRRTMETGAPSKGIELVNEEQQPMIELLRNRIAAVRLGARVASGLSGPIYFPKQTSAVVAQWLGENPGTPVALSDPGLGVLQMTQKTLMSQVKFSRQLLIAAAFDTEQWLRSDITLQHVLAVDFAVFHGLGAGPEPIGVYKAGGVSSTAVGGAMDYSKVLDAQGKVAAKNADVGALGWVMHPTMATNLKGKARFANTDTPVWEGTYDDGRVGGYGAIATNQISNTMTGSERIGGAEIGGIFGNWNDVIIGLWGAIELIVDPFTLAGYGLLQITGYQGADTGIRHGESFTKLTGATG